MKGGKEEHIIVSETTGLPYKADHFRHEFARIRELSGIPTTLQFRDLRRTAATEMGEAGATDDELRAMTGHMSEMWWLSTSGQPIRCRSRPNGNGPLNMGKSKPMEARV